MAQHPANSQDPLTKKYDKRILTRDVVKKNRLDYYKYKGLVDAKFKNPLKKLPIYDEHLYKKALGDQETLIQKVLDARRQGKTPEPAPENLLDAIISDMRNIYMVDFTMIHYCEGELITNQDLTLQDWKDSTSLAKIYYTGFLVCSAMEGYSLIEGFTTINRNTYKYPLYRGVLKMNMRHAKLAYFYSFKLGYNIEEAGYDMDVDNAEC
jgi:hypothetical protein